MAVITHATYKDEYEKASKQAMQIAAGWRESVEEIDKLMKMLKEVNDVLRSAHSIASREGKETNWPAFTKRVAAILEQQHKMIVDYFRDDDHNI